MRLFDAQNASLQRSITTQSSSVLQLAFSGRGTVHSASQPLYLAASGGHRVSIFDASPGSTRAAALFVFEGHTAVVTAVGFDPSSAAPSFAYSASEDGTLKIWNPGLGPPLPPPGADQPHRRNGVTQRAHQPLPNGTANANQQHQQQPQQQQQQVSQQQTQQNQQPNGNPHVQQGYPGHHHPPQPQPHHQAVVPQVPVGAPGYTAGAHGTQPTISAETIAVYVNRQRKAINAVVFFAPKNVFIFADVVGRVCIWSLSSRSLVGTATPHTPSLARFHLQTLELSEPPNPPESPADGPAVPPRIVTADTRGGVFVYDLDTLLADPTQRPLASFSVYDGRAPTRRKGTYITRTRVSVDGTVLACTLSTGAVNVYDMEAIERYAAGEAPSVATRKILANHTSWVWDAVFVGDANNYLFTCSTDMRVYLWQLDIHGGPSEYPGHQKGRLCQSSSIWLLIAAITSSLTFLFWCTDIYVTYNMGLSLRCHVSRHQGNDSRGLNPVNYREYDRCRRADQHAPYFLSEIVSLRM